MANEAPEGHDLPHSLTIETLVQLAVSSAAADLGWLTVPGAGDDLVVLAAAAVDGAPPIARGHAVASDRSYAGFVIGTSQPAALELRDGDERGATELELLGRRSGHLLAVPCTHEDACLGVLEVVASQDRGRFDLDDVELVSLLGTVAGAAIAERLGGAAPPSPDELAGELQRLAEHDPVRFTTVSRLVAAVLGP